MGCGNVIMRHDIFVMRYYTGIMYKLFVRKRKSYGIKSAAFEIKRRADGTKSLYFGTNANVFVSMLRNNNRIKADQKLDRLVA